MKRYHLYILITLVTLFIWNWFSDNLMFINGESGLFFYNPTALFSKSFYVWSEVGTGLPSAFNLIRIPFFSTLTVLSKIGISSLYLQMGYFLFIMLTASFSMYYLLVEVFCLDKDKRVALYGAIFYLFNPYALSQVWARGLYPFFGAYAFFPLTLFFLIKFFNTKRFFYLLMASLASLVFSDVYVHPTTVLTYWVITGLTYFYFLVNSKKKLLLVFSFILFLIIWLGIHFWWLLPYIQSLSTNVLAVAGLSNPKGNVDTLIGVSKFFPLSAVIRLIQYYLFKDLWSFFYDNSFIIAISWLIPITAFFSIDYLKKYKNTKYFIFLFLISIFVVLGANKPTGEIFLFFFEKFSYLQAFRNPYEKFGIVFLIAYTPFFAIGLTHITKRIYKQIVLLFLVCFIFLLPFWNKTFCGIDPEKNNCWTRVPNYVAEANSFLNNQKGDFRIMMLPLAPSDGASYAWPAGNYFGTDPTRFLIDRPAISYNTPGNREYFNILLQRFGDFTPNAFGIEDPDTSASEFKGIDFSEELRKLNVRYIVLRNDLRTEVMNVTSVEEIENLLNSEESIFYQETFGEYDIYKVNIPERVSTLYSENADITFQKINPTKYKFVIEKPDYIEPTELNFLSTYNPNWEIRLESSNLAEHRTLYSYANQWLIEHEGPVSGELVYTPQEYAQKASYISIISILALLIYLLSYARIMR